MAVQVLLLLLVLCSNTHAEDLRRAGGSHYFYVDNKADFCSVYRWAGEEKELMWNSSGFYYEMDRVAVSHSGQYQEQCWTRGNLTLVRNSTILVCGTEKMRSQRLWLDAGQRVELTCDGMGPNQSVQWARDNVGRLELIIEDHKHHLVNSSLLLSVPRYDGVFSYSCLVKQQHRCDILTSFIAHTFTSTILGSVGESLELHCPNSSLNQSRRWSMTNALIPEQERLNSTLMLPSLTVNHSGAYQCAVGDDSVQYDLYVCPESEPPAVRLFTVGENLILHCGDWDQTGWVQWFMRSNRTQGRLSSYWHADNVDTSHRRLVIRNISLQDSGQFWCVVQRGHNNCVFRSETLLMFGEPEVDHFLLRSVLLSAVVLMMLCVVVAVEVVVWRGRRREQLPTPVEELEMSQLSPESDAQEEAMV